jgi:hypothetical protein
MFQPPDHPTTGTFLSWEPDPLGSALGTNYNRFSSTTGIDGLAKIIGNEFRILALHTFTPGQGNFREFIKRCKEEFDSILVEAIMEPELVPTLTRYGFTPTTLTEEWGEKVDALKWQKQ